MLLTVDHLNIITCCFYVFQIVIVVVITSIGQRTLGKHLDESTLVRFVSAPHVFEDSSVRSHFAQVDRRLHFIITII